MGQGGPYKYSNLKGSNQGYNLMYTSDSISLSASFENQCTNISFYQMVVLLELFELQTQWIFLVLLSMKMLLKDEIKKKTFNFDGKLILTHYIIVYRTCLFMLSVKTHAEIWQAKVDKNQYFVILENMFLILQNHFFNIRKHFFNIKHSF